MGEKIICYPANKNAKGIWRIKEDGIEEEGSYGNVLQVCKKNDCKYVIKIVGIGDEDIEDEEGKYNYSVEKLKKEVCFQKICAEHKLCKPVEDWWVCKNGDYGVIITSILKETLENFFEEEKDKENIKKILLKSLKLIHNLHKIGIYHGDLHLSNIMLDEKQNPYLIDLTGDIIKKVDDLSNDYNGFDGLAEISEITGKEIKINTDTLKNMSIDDAEDFIYNKLVSILKKE